MSLQTTDTAVAVADDTGPLSMEDAINALSAEDDGDPAQDDAQTDQGAEDQTALEDDAPGDDDPASEEASKDAPADEAEGDEGEQGEPQQAAIDPPEFWSAEEKALFAKAPPEVQMLVAAKNAEAEKRVYAAKEEAATARKEASRVVEQGELLDQFLAQAEPLFRDKWDGVDFAQWASVDPEAAFKAKLEYDAEQQALTQARSAREAAQAQEHRQFLLAEHGKLKEAGHVLADPEKGKEARQGLQAYMLKQGVPQEAFAWASATELMIAHKAMLFDQLQAERAKKPVATPNPARAAATKPTAPPPPRKVVAQRKIGELKAKVMKTGKLEDAVDLLAAMD